MISSGNSSTNMALDFIGKLFEKLRRPLGFFLLLVLTSILQLIFDMHFVCSCGPGLHVNYLLYIILPSLILTFAVYVVKIFYKKKFFSTVDCCTHKRWPRTCFFFAKRVFEYFSLTALWTAMVLFDGDWSFCVMTSRNSTQTGLPCKKNLTYKEERIKDSYKTDSLDIGLGVCCCLLLLHSLVESFRTQCRSWCHCCRRPYYEAMYKKILSDELSSLIEEELIEIAKMKAKKMCKLKIKKIRNHELPKNNGSGDVVSQIWKDISDPSFIFKMTESNTTTNTEMSDQSETSENEDQQKKTKEEMPQVSLEGEQAKESPNSSSSSFKCVNGDNEERLDPATGGVDKVQCWQPPTVKCPSEDQADCPKPVEEGLQLGEKSGMSMVSGVDVSRKGQVEEEVSQVADGGVSVGGTESGGVTEMVDDLEFRGEASGVDASPTVCVDEGETFECCDAIVSGECVVGDSDVCLEGED